MAKWNGDAYDNWLDRQLDEYYGDDEEPEEEDFDPPDPDDYDPCDCDDCGS